MQNAARSGGALAVDYREAAENSTVAPATDQIPDTTPAWSARLLELGRSHGEIPVYGSPLWHALDKLDPRRFAAVVAAAEAWRQDGTPEAIRRRLAEDDLLVRVRLKAMIDDLAGAPWTRIHDVLRARREVAA